MKAEVKRSGTCQACFGTQAVTGPGAIVVLHGYNRPGDGYAHGKCAGVRFPAYELSCDLSKAWLENVQALRAGLQSELDDLKADRVDVIAWRKVISRVFFNAPAEGSGWERARPTRIGLPKDFGL